MLEHPDAPHKAPQFGKEHRSSLAKAFYTLAKLLVNHPRMSVLYCTMVVAWCCIGLKFLVVDSNPQKIWVPPDSATNLQQNYFNAEFTPFFRIEQVIFTTEARQANMLQPEYLKMVLDVQQQLESKMSSTNTLLDDVCFKPIPGKGCIVESPTNYFRSDATFLDRARLRDIQLATACAQNATGDPSAIPCMSNIGVPVMPEVILGGMGCNLTAVNPDPCGACIPTANSLMLTLLLEDTEEAAAKAAVWEAEVFLPVVEAASAKYGKSTDYPIVMSYMAQRSIQDALSVEEKQNEFVVVVSYVAMFVYISLALGKFPHPVKSRALLGLQGIVIVMCSVAASIGACSFFGVHITMIVTEVVPFLILAIGVDNMFIITKAVDRRAKSHSHEGSEECIAHAMADVGPSISAAALSEFLAFAVGATTQIPALEQFCLVAAVAVFIDYCLQVTWFVAALSLDMRRMNENRGDLFCCGRKYNDAPKMGDSAFWDTILQGQFVHRMMDKYYTPFILKPVVKPIILVLWAVILGWGCYGATRLELGLEQQLVLPTKHYLQSYFSMQSSLGDAGPPMYVVLQDVNYTHPNATTELEFLVNSLEKLESVIEPPVYSWVTDFAAWWSNREYINTKLCSGDPAPCDCPFILPESETTFPERVQQYVNISVDSTCCQRVGYCGQQYAQDVMFGRDDNGELQILSSRLRGQHTALRNQSDFIQSMQITQAAVDLLQQRLPKREEPLAISDAPPLAPGGTAFPYSLFYVYYAQYSYIQGVAIQNMFLAIGAVFLAVLTVASGATAIMVSVCVTSIAISIVGFLYLLNPSEADQNASRVDINAVSVVNLVMAVGLSVEFCVHVASAFGSKQGTRQQRVAAAMSEMGSSVVTGITLTKFCGVAVLGAAPSRLFRLYYFRMYLGIVLLGAFNGLAALPVILSYIGSPPANVDKDVTKDDDTDSHLSDERARLLSADDTGIGYGALSDVSSLGSGPA